MCLATHEWQAMTFYKGYDDGMGGLHSRHGGGSFLARCGQDTSANTWWYTSSNRIRKGDTVTGTTSAETGTSEIVCRFYPDKYVFE